MFCREQVARITVRKPELDAAGVGLVAIGNGSAAMAKDFAQDFDLSIDLYTDPSRKVYAAAGLKRNFGIGPAAVRRGFRALGSGHKQGRTKGDPWQQGGVLLVDTDGSVLYQHVDSGAGDHADEAAVMRAVGQVASR